MKISGNFFGFNISARGMRIQRKKMNLIAENIANSNTRTADGQPYKKKFLKVTEQKNLGVPFNDSNVSILRLKTEDPDHMQPVYLSEFKPGAERDSVQTKEMIDNEPGSLEYDPGNPYANSQGYVEDSNVNVITEMVDMIAASRNYEANLTALNSSKQMVKDSLEI